MSLLSSTMDKTLFTQDGKKYVLKSQTKLVDNFAVGTPDSIEMNVFVNNPNTGGISAWKFMTIDTSNQIIPLMYCFAAFDIGGNAMQADIASPFYTYIQANARNYKHLLPLAKTLTMAEIKDVTNVRNYHYTMKYNQIIPTSADFLSTTGLTQFSFVPYQGMAMVNQLPFAASYPNIVLPAATYRFALNFIYFELQ